MKSEYIERALDCQESYIWADGQYGMLTEIISVTRYLVLMGFNYVEPLVPPLTHVGNIAQTNVQNTSLLTAENEEKQLNYAIYGGFCKGMDQNICNVLQGLGR